MQGHTDDSSSLSMSFHQLHFPSYDPFENLVVPNSELCSPFLLRDTSSSKSHSLIKEHPRSHLQPLIHAPSSVDQQQTVLFQSGRVGELVRQMAVPLQEQIKRLSQQIVQLQEDLQWTRGKLLCSQSTIKDLQSKLILVKIKTSQQQTEGSKLLQRITVYNQKITTINARMQPLLKKGHTIQSLQKRMNFLDQKLFSLIANKVEGNILTARVKDKVAFLQSQTLKIKEEFDAMDLSLLAQYLLKIQDKQNNLQMQVNSQSCAMSHLNRLQTIVQDLQQQLQQQHDGIKLSFCKFEDFNDDQDLPQIQAPYCDSQKVESKQQHIQERDIVDPFVGEMKASLVELHFKNDEVERLQGFLCRRGGELPLAVCTDETGYLKYESSGMYLFDQYGNMFKLKTSELQHLQHKGILQIL